MSLPERWTLGKFLGCPKSRRSTGKCQQRGTGRCYLSASARMSIQALKAVESLQLLEVERRACEQARMLCCLRMISYRQT